MWGNHAPPGPSPMPPPSTGSGLRIAAVVLLVLAAALTLGGSFGTITVYTSDYVVAGSRPSPTAYARTAWTAALTPPADSHVTAPLDGYVLAIGVLLVLAAVVVLLTSGRAPGGRARGRSAGVGAAALLVGAIGHLWLGVLESLVSTAQGAAERRPDSGFTASITIGIGGWLLLVALVLAGAAAVLLLASARSDAPRPASYAVRP